MRITEIAALAAVAFAVHGPALAHGEKHDAAKTSVDYSSAEETAFGKAADPRKAKRTVRLDMADTMRFTPSEITVKRGDTVRFVAKNSGKLLHEMVLGTRKDLEAHAELMKKFPAMEHDEPNMVHVAPGKSGEIGWQFTKPGEVYFACLIPGHYEAGMIGKVTVR